MRPWLKNCNKLQKFSKMNLQTIFHIWTFGIEKLITSGHVYGKSLPIFFKEVSLPKM